jgi:DNA-binding NarL/FixJ family response regulator
VRILGEALTNARRHADASSVRVRVTGDARSLTATVEDDGRGTPHAPAGGGHGIAGMRERAALLGGALTITSSPDEGTRVQIRAPLVAASSAAEPVRVLIVDDHAAIRESIALAFEQDDAFCVAGLAGSLAEARRMLEAIDVAIVDPGLPDGDGTEIIADLRAANPQAQALVLSATVDRAATARAVECGAAAVLSKTTHLHQLVTAVHRLRAGETLIPLDETVDLLRFAGRERERARDEQRRIDTLTPREREVLQLLAEGLDGRAVAARLHISPRTQRNHVANILAKLEVHSQLQALVFALRHRVVEVGGADDPDEDDARSSLRSTGRW